MTIQELTTLIDAKNLVEDSDQEATITCGNTCDLLSWVLAHGEEGMAWCTVQSHVNVVAVAVLMDMACVILVENVQPDPPTLQKAVEESLPILSTSLTAYEVCGLLYQAGVTASVV